MAISVDVPTDLHSNLWIGGEWRESSLRERFEVIDPATELHIGTVASATVEDCRHALSAAADGLARWSRTAPRERAEVLRRSWELMMKNHERIARIVTLENGKSLGDARAEVTYAAEFFRWNAEESVRICGQIGHAPGSGMRIIVQHKPAGIALLVTPWNFPAAMATRKIAPALAAGCSVVIKPATSTPLTLLALMPLLEEAGVPPGVINVLPSRRSAEVVRALLADQRVRVLSFTGSTDVGRALIREAATNVVRPCMELGGNAPFIVFADADLDAAVDGAMIAKMRNGGEACTAANRFYVHESISNAFSEKLAGRMATLKIGNGFDESVAVGPLISADARNKVAGLVADAQQRGAHVLTGGSNAPGPGFFYLPTVVTQVPADAEIVREEIFGPVAAIQSFQEEEEVVRLANDSEVGLAAYVYTCELARALRVAESLEVGMVGINRGIVSEPAAPFGGVKQSGLGREGGREGVMEYLETQYIAASW